MTIMAYFISTPTKSVTLLLTTPVYARSERNIDCHKDKNSTILIHANFPRGLYGSSSSARVENATRLEYATNCN